MHRTIALPAAALLGLNLLTLAGPAHAAETCQGEPVTLVGKAGTPLLGTEGPDVIATHGASRTDSLGGDDLICLTGIVDSALPSDAQRVEVDAGAGNDRVEAATEGWGSYTELGTGADIFVASNADEHWITTGLGVDRTLTDSEADVVRIAGTGRVTSGDRGQDNPDVIEFARGELFWSGHQVAPGSVAVGPDSSLHLAPRGNKVDLEARAGTMESANTSLTFSGFTEFVVGIESRTGRFSFRGSHRDERLALRSPTTYDRYVVMGGGDDHYSSDGLGGKDSWVRGSGGEDSLTLSLPHHHVRAAMQRSSVTATRGDTVVVARTGSFEKLKLSARHADVSGTRRGEQIIVAACRADVRAGSGKDFVLFRAQLGSIWDPPSCSSYRARANGGRGADTLLGGPGNDTLIGGQGVDLVVGRSGRDACEGEKRRTCEARIRG